MKADAKNNAPKSYNVRVTDAAGTTLWLRAFVTKSGARSECIQQTGSGKARKNSRGLTQNHATLAEAQRAVDLLAKAAEKAGWKRRESRGGGFARKPDAFAALPKPKKR